MQPHTEEAGQVTINVRADAYQIVQGDGEWSGVTTHGIKLAQVPFKHGVVTEGPNVLS